MRSLYIASLILIQATCSSALWAQTVPTKAKLQLMADVDSVTPGQTFQVGLEFDIDDKWHIYWKNGGDAGIPPKVTWDLPPGFTISQLQFPTPRQYVDKTGLVSIIHEGRVMLLAQVKPPATLSDSTVTLKAHVKYLLCAEVCLRLKADVKFTLPVAKAGSDPKPANVESFARARNALPLTESKYVSVRANTSVSQFRVDTTFDLLLDVAIAKGHHIQSNTPLNKAFVKCEVFMEPAGEIFFDPPTYPKPKIHTLPTLGKISEYEGNFQIRIPGEVYEAPTSYPVRFAGIFKYQACTAKGRCYPPEALAFSVDVGTQSDNKVGTAITPTKPGDLPPRSTTPTKVVGSSDLPKTFLGLLAFAFLGGLILNIMPCVLPVISIKILSFVQQAKESPRRVVGLGLSFAAGMVMSFWALAVLIIALKAAGNELGWGFQFQSPRFVLVMIAVIFAFGLSLLGVFEITLPGAATTKLSAAQEREGFAGAFMKGVLGTVLATPCTAPFLGPALGVAFRSTNMELFAIFTAIGFGMASPFIILSAFPSWLRFMPKPGAWMEHFKQAMGFMLLGTVVWLMFTLGDQVGAPGLVWTAMFLIFLAIACWILGRQTPMTPVGRRLVAWAFAVGFAVGGWWLSFEGGWNKKTTVEVFVQNVRDACDGVCANGPPSIPRSAWDDGIPWQRWNKGWPQQLAAQGYTVYVDYTATWCATCLANKKATLETKRVRQMMRDNCVIPIKADFTLENPDILTDLNSFDRSGVPLNVIYPANQPDQPIVMPEQLVGRATLVVDRLSEAGPSESCIHTALATPSVN